MIYGTKMPYSIGDILLKVDERATSATVNTRHHVMLVVEESENGVPVVMHMLGEPHWKLVKEELTRGKDLIKVHCSWPKQTREAAPMAPCETQDIGTKHTIETTSIFSFFASFFSSKDEFSDPYPGGGI